MQNLQLPDKPANQDSSSISLGDRTHRAAIHSNFKGLVEIKRIRRK